MSSLKFSGKYIVVMVFIGIVLLGNSVRSTAQVKNPNILPYDGYPTWSPDGEQIAFVSGRSGNYDIWVMDSDGSNMRNLTPNDPNANFAPIWSPDGQYIGYIAAPEDEGFYDALSGTAIHDVWAMTSNGTSPINLTDNFKGKSGDFEWSPDGEYVVFVAGIATIDDVTNLESGIWIIKPDGTNATVLIRSDEHQFGSPSWAPDGQSVAFIQASTDPLKIEGIRVITIDDGNLQIVTERHDTQVKWSPKGDVLALTTLLSDGSGMYDVWRIDVSGDNLQNLTPETPQLDRNPVWSPDGLSLAFESNRGIPNGYGRDIWVMSAEGGNPTNLTSELDWSIRPVWSPDGKRIAFESNSGDFELIGLNGESDIWIMNADGSNKTNVTNMEIPNN